MCTHPNHNLKNMSNDLVKAGAMLPNLATARTIDGHIEALKTIIESTRTHGLCRIDEDIFRGYIGSCVKTMYTKMSSHEFCKASPHELGEMFFYMHLMIKYTQAAVPSTFSMGTEKACEFGCVTTHKEFNRLRGESYCDMYKFIANNGQRGHGERYTFIAEGSDNGARKKLAAIRNINQTRLIKRVNPIDTLCRY